MNKLVSTSFRHARNILLISVLNVVIFFVLDFRSLQAANATEYFEILKFFIFLVIYSSATVLPGYLVFLALIKILPYAPKRNPWDVIALCFLLYLIVSQFIPLGDEVNIWTFSDADKIFAIIDILLFAALNYTGLKDRGNPLL